MRATGGLERSVQLVRHPLLRNAALALAGATVVAVLVWQAVTAGGNPDPGAHGITPAAGILDTAVLVYREGLECILVLSAIVAGLVRKQSVYWKPVAVGAGVGFLATMATWFVLVGVLALAAGTTSELALQATTGLLAIVVLMIVMNWFFHRIYWTGWISLHNRRKQQIIDSAESSQDTGGRTAGTVAYKGLLVLGLASVYREGFEVDLFLQNLRLQIGWAHVALGAGLALVLVVITGYVTFVAHRKLPYKRMLVATGILLGAVFLVMVGEQVNEMQLAHWLPVHPLPVHLPAWTGVWFSLYANWETVVAQAAAAIVVIGSYYAAQLGRRRPRPRATGEASVKAGTDAEVGASTLRTPAARTPTRP
jgi:high-affinity iron transporter